MKYSILTSILLILLMGCFSTLMPDRAYAALQETATQTYSIHTASKGIEGYVGMTFDISKSGDPINIKVIKSVPEHVFDKATVETLSNWKYAPKVVDGIAVKEKDIEVRLDLEVG